MANSFSVYTSFKAKDGMSNVFKNMRNNANSFGGRLTNLKSQAVNAGNSMRNSFASVKFALLGIATAIATSTIKNTLQSWVDKASDLQETLGKTNETFKTDASTITNWAKNSIKSMGLAQQTALDTAALYGDMGSGMGLTTKRAAEMSMSLTQLSADLASFKNVRQDISSNALKGVFTGETEALKNLGIVMTDANLQEFAKKQGIKTKTKDMTQNQKVELRYQYVMASTKNAQGDFLRTGGNFANQSRMFEEQKKELETNLGNVLLPKYNAVMKSLNAMLVKYSPQIEKGFAKLFANFEEGLKICTPLFESFQRLFRALTDVLLPNVQTSLPIIKTLLEGAIVPALVLVIDSITNIVKFGSTLYGIITGTFNFLKNNWLPLLLILPIAIAGVQFALDMWRLKMALLRMEGGLFAVVMNTRLLTAITSFTSAVWKSVAAFAAQSAAFLASPVGLITLGVMALVGVVILLWKNWDKVTQTFQRFKENFENFKKSHPKIFGNNTTSTVQIQNANGQNVQNKTVQQNGNKNGKIDVGIKLDNSTNYPASTTLNLENPSGMTLIPR